MLALNMNQQRKRLLATNAFHKLVELDCDPLEGKYAIEDNNGDIVSRFVFRKDAEREIARYNPELARQLVRAMERIKKQ